MGSSKTKALIAKANRARRRREKTLERQRQGLLGDLILLPRTLSGYTMAVCLFLVFLGAVAVDLESVVTECRLDRLVAEYLEHLLANGDGRSASFFALHEEQVEVKLAPGLTMAEVRAPKQSAVIHENDSLPSGRILLIHGASGAVPLCTAGLLWVPTNR